MAERREGGREGGKEGGREGGRGGREGGRKGGRGEGERVCAIALCVGMDKWVPKHTTNSLGTCVCTCNLQLNVHFVNAHSTCIQVY